jgi:hypothetical protein
MFKQISQGSITKIYYIPIGNSVAYAITVLAGVFMIILAGTSLIESIAIFSLVAIILAIMLFRIWKYDTKPIIIDTKNKKITQGNNIINFKDVKTFYIKITSGYSSVGKNYNLYRSNSARIAVRTKQNSDVYLTGTVFPALLDRQRLKVVAALCDALKIENPYDDKGRLKDPVHIAPIDNIYSKKYQDENNARLKKYGYARVIGEYIRGIKTDGEDSLSVFVGRIVLACIVLLVALAIILSVALIIHLL